MKQENKNMNIETSNTAELKNWERLLKNRHEHFRNASLHEQVENPGRVHAVQVHVAQSETTGKVSDTLNVLHKNYKDNFCAVFIVNCSFSIFQFLYYFLNTYT